MTKINKEAWEKLRLQMEYHLEQDPNLTDIAINYQVRVPETGTKNYLRLSVKIDNN
jgi:hypothetical protein